MKLVKHRDNPLDWDVRRWPKAMASLKARSGKGKVKELELEVEKRDRYGRLLVYVFLQEGRLLNEEIVKAGYANLLTVPPDVKHEEKFRKAYREAREKRRGLWK